MITQDPRGFELFYQHNWNEKISVMCKSVGYSKACNFTFATWLLGKRATKRAATSRLCSGRSRGGGESEGLQ